MIYPLDPTGVNPANRIVDEIKVVTPPAKITDANFIVPNVTPFFKEGLSVTLGTRALVEGVDYQLVFRHIDASEHFVKEIFGGIMFYNKEFTGTVKVTYQVLGGDFQNNNPKIIEDFTKAIGAVRWVTFDQILGLPSSFPPAYHMHDLERDLVDMGDVVTSVEKIATALQGKSGDVSEINARLEAHLTSRVSHSKESVGLGNVRDYPIATFNELVEGTIGRYVTASILKNFYDQVILPRIPARPNLSNYFTREETQNLLRRKIREVTSNDAWRLPHELANGTHYRIKGTTNTIYIQDIDNVMQVGDSFTVLMCINTPCSFNGTNGVMFSNGNRTITLDKIGQSITFIYVGNNTLDAIVNKGV